MSYKKFMIIGSICLIIMVVGVAILYNHDISNAIGAWVFEGAAEGNYSAEQADFYSNLMIILVLGMPVFAIIFAIIRAIFRHRLKKKLEREGRFDEYRELFGRCDR